MNAREHKEIRTFFLPFLKIKSEFEQKEIID